MKVKILSWLLHHANSSPSYKEAFYKIKSDLLLRYGTLVGTDLQHISKTCYSCDGTGIFIHWHGMGSAPCYKCMGTGIYEEFYTLLQRYQLGKHVFHRPVQRTYISKYTKETLPTNYSLYPVIEGFIKHKTSPYRLNRECELWLYLLFDRKQFIRMFRFSTATWHNIRTPLVFLNRLYWLFSTDLPNISQRKLKLLNKLKFDFAPVNHHPIWKPEFDELPF